MAQPSQADEPPYRSYEEIRRDLLPCLFSPTFQRLDWSFDSDSTFPTAISVMKTLRNLDDLEPFFQPGSDTTTSPWHEISQLPLTKPKVSSIEASIEDLEQWEAGWMLWHEEHEHPQANQEYVTYGDLDDDVRPYRLDGTEDGNWEEDSDKEFLVKCCGEDRPLRKRGLKLVVTPAAGGHFVTMHDYLSAAHPWLMSLREDIMKQKLVERHQARPESYVANTKWVVDRVDGEPKHTIKERQEWVQRHGPRRPKTAADLMILEKIRAIHAQRKGL